MPAVYVGIDPGGSGGLAWISVGANGGVSMNAVSMPDTRLGILKWMVNSNGGQIPRIVMIEKVGGFMASAHGSAENHKNMASAHTMFAFGKNVGWLEMACEMIFERQATEVLPAEWQRAVGVLPRLSHKVGRQTVWDETKTQYKNNLKQAAERLYPNFKLTLKTCDAVLLAHYGRMRNGFQSAT